MRTSGVKQLVECALAGLPKPLTEDVIDDVFHAIEHHPEWRQDYEDLCTNLGKTVVNTWGGYWIANHEGRSGHQQVPSKKSNLIGSYSKLTAATTKTNAKRKESVAMELMSAYYHEHSAELPVRVRDQRELLIELLMEGVSVEEAFSMVLADGT